MIRRAIPYLSTRLSTSRTHLLWTARTRGAMSQDLSALPAAAFTANVVEMLDCARCLFIDPYFSTAGCADKCSWGKNRACLLWLLIPHPQFRIKCGELRIRSNKIRSEGSISLCHACNRAPEGWYDPFLCCPFFSIMRNWAVDTLGARINAETCHSIATGKD